MVNELSAGKRQMIEIAKALSSNASILLLDEPTASISLKEAGILFDTVRRLQAQGVAFIFVSHKLEEIYQMAGRVTVATRWKKRRGEPGLRCLTLTTDELIALMVGRSAKVAAFPGQDASSAPVVLEARRSKANGARAAIRLRCTAAKSWVGMVWSARQN